jgi:hypothetical protein
VTFARVRAGDDLTAAIESVRTLGACVIEDAVDPATCDSLRDAMLATLDEAAKGKPAEDTPGHVQHTPRCAPRTSTPRCSPTPTRWRSCGRSSGAAR